MTLLTWILAYYIFCIVHCLLLDKLGGIPTSNQAIVLYLKFSWLMVPMFWLSIFSKKFRDYVYSKSKNK